MCNLCVWKAKKSLGWRLINGGSLSISCISINSSWSQTKFNPSIETKTYEETEFLDAFFFSCILLHAFLVCIFVCFFFVFYSICRWKSLTWLTHLLYNLFHLFIYLLICIVYVTLLLIHPAFFLLHFFFI